MLKQLLFCLILQSAMLFAVPMESLGEYNIVLVHGAGSHWGGLDCENGDLKYEKFKFPDETYRSAYEYYDFKTDARIGGKFSEGLISDDTTSSATGMIADLKPWINDELFEGDYEALVYLQRPFINPANSPSNNGKEIGKRTWKGVGKCSA
ncbi:MAG: hypothetical protein HUJ74_02765, partial [Lachnospiraceae bacterium]|nr:hypothetical protein [Lachnospiraceae bacterium]